jgi:NDP-sugar pyrophosphorylase family protein
MKAIVFAAGMGTRLRPHTDHKPKALVEIEGVPLLEILLRRLEAEGFSHIVINVHHFAEQMLAFIQKRQKHSRAALYPSLEKDVLLDTGGGLFAAQSLIGADTSFLVHNVDVLSDIPLAQLLSDHERSGALATLAVKDRETRRKLLFSAQGCLCGRREDPHPLTVVRPEAGPFTELAFCGIQAVSGRWFERTTERGVFGIMHNYLRLAGESESIRAWDATHYRWKDVGRPEHLSPL